MFFASKDRVTNRWAAKEAKRRQGTAPLASPVSPIFQPRRSLAERRRLLKCARPPWRARCWKNERESLWPIVAAGNNYVQSVAASRTARPVTLAMPATASASFSASSSYTGLGSALVATLLYFLSFRPHPPFFFLVFVVRYTVYDFFVEWHFIIVHFCIFINFIEKHISTGFMLRKL